MRCLLVCLLLGLLLPRLQAQGPPPGTIGEIEFFGIGSTDLLPVRAGLPIHEGDQISVGTVESQIVATKTSLAALLHHPPSNVAVVCCDGNGEWMFYLGLNAAPSSSVNSAPRASVALPAVQLRLYSMEDQALEKAVLAGNSGEDDGKGYALTNDPVARRLQLGFRAYAVDHGKLIRRVALESSSAPNRRAAAQLLGYCLRSSAQLAALDHATRDPDQIVRNNAIRALSVLAGSSPSVARSIPPAGFIAQLNSGNWTDRNKSSLLLVNLTESRPPSALEQMRREALPSLIEMARWRSRGHAFAALVLLGRIAGVDEQTLGARIAAGETDQIIQAASLH